MAFYVFDLDGTLADLSHRLSHIQGETKDWRAFFASVADDQPIDHVIRVYRQLKMTPQNRMEIWSGRSDECREQTEDWLIRHGLVNIHENNLRMRKAGDHRPDHLVKREFLDKFGRPDVIFDDRNQVVEMWRREGIPCFQVADGAF